jgi:pimeloyl-ACP methyl ester carboxylesterase
MMLVAAFLALLLSVAVLLVAVSVLVSFSIARQARTPVTDGEFAALPLGMMLREFTCLLLTLLWRPFGWLPPRITPGDAGKPPVLLLHGLFQNRSCLLLLQRQLQRAGYRTMSINTPPWHDLATLTNRVGDGVNRLRVATGADRVHLVGHSMGGILARSYLQTSGTEWVANCVTIGAPHTGSQLAVFAVSRLGRALLPGSPLLAQLNTAPLPTGIKLTAIFSSDDNIIVPAENARFEGADNLEISGIGHTAMLFSEQVSNIVMNALAVIPGQSKI